MASDSELVEKSVERAQWEPLHEWESRLKFVEDNLNRHGLEKATQLSIVWANMNFLGCRYPVNTESLVSWYPLPSIDEIRERRSRHPIKRPPQESADGVPEAKKPAPSRQEVSDLISSIRSKTEQPTGLVESIGRKLCLCVKCIGECENSAVRAQRVLEKHTAICNEPVEMTFKESPEGHSCVLVFQGETVLESTANHKKDAKSAVCDGLMKKVEEWQEANQLPPCRHATPAPTSHSYTPSHDQYPPPQGHYPPSQGHYQHQGNSYHPPNSYHEQPRYPPRGSGNQWSSHQQRGNYFMPPPSRGAGQPRYRGGYNKGSYGH